MIWNWSLADFYVIDWILQINNHFDYSINKIRSVESWKHLEHNANTHPEIGAKLISHALLRQLASTADQLTKKSSVPTSLLSVTVPAYAGPLCITIRTDFGAPKKKKKTGGGNPVVNLRSELRFLVKKCLYIFFFVVILPLQS